MPETFRKAAQQMADFVIERHLAGAYAQLDAGTADVETRKHVYASFVERALTMASERLPDPDLWRSVISRMSGHTAAESSMPLACEAG